MDNTTTPADADLLALRSIGALAGVNAELAARRARLLAAPDWRPARQIEAELAWVQQQLDRMAADWGHKLVVALVGPSGAGKSTLLNALAGREVSPTGLERPTTRSIVAYAAHEADVAGLGARWGETDVQVQVAPAAPGLQHLVLVDAPDTNTTPEGLAALGRVLDTADVLVAVFAAQNPRLHDNIRFLAPYIRQLPPEAVLPVINMADRAPLDELRKQVVPDLRQAIAANWGFSPAHIYLVSARASLPDAAFPQDEAPLHAVNEFEALRRFLFEVLNRGTQVVDRRLARARHLLALVDQDLAAALAQHAAALTQAGQQRDRLSQALTALLQQTLRQRAGELPGLELHAALYSRLAARWWGPVGWVVALWGLLVRAVAWVAHLGRRGRPLAGGAADGFSLDGSGLDQALDRFYAEHWPPVADALSAAGFDGWRDRQRWQAEARRTQEGLQARSAAVLDESLAVGTRHLAHPLLQVALNGPVLGLLGWVGYQAVSAFVTGQYLPATYFQNAGIALLAVWAVCFVLLQLLVSLAVRTGIRRRAVRALANAATWPLAAGVDAQLAALLR